jgi:hypothetical protein
MGDYVLESNPALERLIDRLGARGEPPPHEESSSSNGNATRSRRGRRSKVQATDRPEIVRGDHTAAGAKDPAEHATVAEPAAIAEEEQAVVEDDLWAICEDPQPTDEMVLVDFDEEPEVFDEDLGDYDEDEDEADEADEVLDLYEGEEPDDEDETAYEDDEVFDEVDVVLEEEKEEVFDEVDVVLEEEKEEEDVDDLVPVEVVGAFDDEELDDEQIVDEDRELVDEGAEALDDNRHEGGDWILDAFEAWKLEVVEDYVVQDEEILEAFDEDEVDADADADADEFIEVFDEDTEDPVEVAEPDCEQSEVPVSLLEPMVDNCGPYHLAPSDLSSKLSVNAGRTKARHKRQSPRQRKRSLRKAEQDARGAEKSSKKAAAKSQKKAILPSISQTDLRAESSSVLSG